MGSRTWGLARFLTSINAGFAGFPICPGIAGGEATLTAPAIYANFSNTSLSLFSVEKPASRIKLNLLIITNL